MSTQNPHGLHRMRHDCAALFEMALLPSRAEAKYAGADPSTYRWDMTPCCVRLGDCYVPPATPGVRQGFGDDQVDHPDGPEWFIARHPYQLLALPDETEVLCPWPGSKKLDVFRFTVGEFRAAWFAAEREWQLGRAVDDGATFLTRLTAHGPTDAMAECKATLGSTEVLALAHVELASEGVPAEPGAVSLPELALAKAKSKARRKLIEALAKEQAEIVGDVEGLAGEGGAA